MTSEPPEGFEPEPEDPSAHLFPDEEKSWTDDEKIFSSGEGMVTLGGAIVLLVWLIFYFFLEDYHIETAFLLVAAVAVVLPRFDPDLIAKVAPLPVLMKILGYLLAVAGIFQVITDLRFGQLNEFIEILAALGAYIGYAVAFLGARSIET